MTATEVRHYESWTVTIHREEDEWPDKILVQGTRTRWMKPETVSFGLKAGHEHPEGIMVFGPRTDGDHVPAVSRYRAARLPDWLAAVIEDARQEHGLDPVHIAGE